MLLVYLYINTYLLYTYVRLYASICIPHQIKYIHIYTDDSITHK